MSSMDNGNVDMTEPELKLVEEDPAEGKEKGLFTTRKVQAEEILLRKNPLLSVEHERGKSPSLDDICIDLTACLAMSSTIVIEDDEENEVANITNRKCTTVAVLKDEEDECLGENTSNGMNDYSIVKNKTNDQPAAKTVSDEEWFASLPTTELEFYEDHLQFLDTNGMVLCTACFYSKLIDRVRRHPVLGVPVCKSCYRLYHSGAWSRDEDGFFDHCRWCANGGDLLCCDTCSNAFCRICIKRNLGRRRLDEIDKLKQWSCLVCDPSQVLNQRSVYFSVWRYQQQLLNGGKFDD